MAAFNQPSSSASIDPGDHLHPSLLGIAAAMEQSERERKQRMSVAQDFLHTIDAWAKSKVGTEGATLVAPLIENISPIVTAFAIGKTNAKINIGKKPAPETTQEPIPGPRATKPAEKPRHELPPKPRENASPWVTVARKAAKLPDPPVNLVKHRPVVHTKPKKQEPPKEDKRLFLRLGQGHQWRKLSPVTIKKIVTKKAGVAPSAIIAMTQVRSGLAIECASDALRETILSVGASLQKEDITIEPASDWTSVMVPHVPVNIRTLDGRIVVTSEMVKTECQSVCGVAPIQARPNDIKLGQYSTSWIVHFKQAPANLKFRLFDESGPAIPFSRKRPIEQCQRCWGYHSTRNCVKGQRCVKCSGTHEAAECTADIPKCSNCAGPHESTHLDCMARPRRYHGQVTSRSPAELRIIRERGHRDFKAAILRSQEKGKAREVINIPEETMVDNE